MFEGELGTEKAVKSVERQGMMGLAKADERERKSRGMREPAKVDEMGPNVAHPHS